MFKGFKIKYPTYTVTCPQTGFVFDVRSLNVAEVSTVKTSLTVPAKAASLINKAIWDVLESKPEFIKTFDEFKKAVTLRDREALLYGLYVATFDDEVEFEIGCSTCGAKQPPLKTLMSKLFGINLYPASNATKGTYKMAKAAGDDIYDADIEKSIADEDLQTIPEGMPSELAAQEFGKQEVNMIDEDEDDGITLGEKQGEVKFVDEPQEEKEDTKTETTEDILTRRLKIELPISKVIAYIKQPTVYDEEKVMNAIPYAQKKQTDLVNETLVIERFEQVDDAGRVSAVTDREDILYGYQSLPPKDKALIFEEFQKEFGQYGVDLKTGFDCSSCGAENDMEIDIGAQFFRMVIRS